MPNTFKTLLQQLPCTSPLRVNNDGGGSCVIDGLNERERERERERLQWGNAQSAANHTRLPWQIPHMFVE
jgi:hypothetical protein